MIDTLPLQEAKDSSEIENIVTTHDELYAYEPESASAAAKYLDALTEHGFVEKQKKGRTNFYINRPLFNLLTQIRLDNE